MFFHCCRSCMQGSKTNDYQKFKELYYNIELQNCAAKEVWCLGI